MVAVVSGNGLGLFATSLTQLGAGLGGQPSIGASRADQYVNVATGNLILTGWDESLFGHGMATGLVRTYNSQGSFSQAGADGWQTGYERTVRLASGSVNTAGSTVERATADGGVVTYAWDASRTAYVSTAGDGAHDTITLSGSKWLWTEGSTQVEETYTASTPSAAGKLEKITDLATNATYTLTYTGTLLTKITGTNSETLEFSYDASNRLIGLSTRERNASNVLVLKGQVSYGYDAAGRLSWVQTDLTPDNAADNAWDAVTAANNDGKSYRVTYTYADASSLRITGVATSDGIAVAYTYDGSGRIASVRQGAVGDGSAQTLTYTYSANETTVTDGAGRSWTYRFDAARQLTAVLEPAVAGQRAVTEYTYDAAGNVTRIRQAAYAGAASALDTVYQYDANGNVILQRDQAGNTVTRTYSAINRVLTEAHYTVADADGLDPTHAGTTNVPSGAMVMRYVYDTTNPRLLRFVISGTGEVTETQYNTSGVAQGLVSMVRRFTDTTYDISGLGLTSVPALADMTGWSAGKVAQTARTDFTYDAQGRLSQQTEYAAVNTSGAGVLDAATSITRYTYDAQGLLRQQVTVHGTARTLTGAAPSGSEVVDYVYDGLGRLLSTIRRSSESAANDDANTVTTTTAYLDAAHTIVTTLDSGMVRTEVRNAAGQLVSLSEAGTVGGSVATRTTQNIFDATGRLRAVQDDSGARTYFFYDAAGRLSETVDATGSVTRTLYDAIGRVSGSVAYATRVTTTGWYAGGVVTKDTLVYAASSPTLAGNQAWVKTDAANDRTATRSYDAAGRLATEVDAAGLTTVYAYDGAGRLLSTTASKAGDPTGEPRLVRYFYDAADRVMATLDAGGRLVETSYDAAGRAIRVLRYATPTANAYREQGTLAQLRPALDAANDRVERYFYDGRGNQVGQLDAEGYFTEFVYDEKNYQRQVKAYAKQLTGLTGSETLAQLRTAATTNAPAEKFRLTTRSFNGLGQLVTELNAEGRVTRYSYDEAGRLVRTENAQGTSEVREDYSRYDVFGQLIGELSGAQAAAASAALGKSLNDPSLTDAQLDGVYAQYGIRHSYDLQGRRTESIDASGAKTFYFYDAVGRQTFTVRGVKDGNGIANAQGEVTEVRYTAFGQVSEELAYTGRIAIATPGSRASVQSAISTLSFVAATDTRRLYAYDQRGLLTRQTNAEGVQTAMSYSAFGQLYELTTAYGTADASTTRYLYNPRGLMNSRTEAYGTAQARTTVLAYDSFGNVNKVTDGRGNATTFAYDRLGRQVEVSRSVSGQVESTRTTYDAFGRVVSQRDARNNVTTYAHSDSARSVVVTTPEGVSVTTVHNLFGQTVSVSQALPGGGTAGTTTSYDKNGAVLSVVDALGNATSNAYDVRGLLAEGTDASGRKVQYTYDAAGRMLTRVEDPGAGKLNLTTTYSYDGQGRQLTVTDASGRVSRMSYDREGRLTQVAEDPEGLNLRTVTAYDAAGRVLRVTDGYGTAAATTVEYAYDALGRRTSETVDPGTGKLNLTTHYAYDANDNLVGRTDANGAVTRLYYDEANRLVYSVDATGALTRNRYDANGSLSATRTYAQRLTSAQLSALTETTAITALDALAVESASDSGRYLVYDKSGALRFGVDLLGGVERVLYDTAGRAVGSRSYATRISLTSPLIAKLRAGTAVDSDLGLAANETLDQRAWQVRDAAGRVVYTIDGLGNTQETYYDAAGRVAGTRSYATSIALTAALKTKLDAGTAKPTDISAVLTVVDGKDLRSYQVLDAAGRVRYSLDAYGAVTEYFQDASGRTVGTRRYAKAIAVNATLLAQLKAGTATVASIAALVVATDSADQQSYQVYDAAGNARFRVDVIFDASGVAKGIVTESQYDARGQLVGYRECETLVPAATMTAALPGLRAGTATVATVGGWMTGTLRETSYVYDAAGRVRYVLRRGSASTLAVSEMQYDGVGRVVAEIAYGVSIPAATARTTAAVASALGSAGGTTAANQRVTRSIFDAQGRLRFVVDDLWGVSEQRYDGAGHAVQSRRYLQPIPSSTAMTESAVAAAVAGQSGSNVRATTTVYDSVGQVVSVTDAAGISESYTYDALGNRISYKNKLGSVWIYAYDAAGRQIKETSPAVTVATADNAGTVTLTSRAVVTQLAYDALGNVVSRTEDATGAAPRTTQYQYDNRGNQIKTIFPDAGALNASTGALAATGIQPTIEVTYNALNQAVVQKDVRGNYSYKVHDTLGRLLYDIDQENQVSGYTYNAYGEQTVLTRYATRANLTAIAGWAAGSPILLNQALAAGVLTTSATADRTLTTAYDLLGRKTSVTQAAVTYVKADGSTATGSPTTQFTYNAYGDVVKTAVLVDAANGIWANTWQYYDDLGRNTLTVDAEGYVTKQTFDALGELTQATEYARALSSAALAALTTATPPAVPAAGDATTGYDRTTQWTYDALGRKTAEIAVGLRYQNAAGTTTTRNVQTSFGYDAEGHLTTTTTDAGQSTAATTTTQYDALGHVVGVKEPVRASIKATAGTSLLSSVSNTLDTAALYEQVSPYTTLAYDAFGNLVTTRRYANGWVSGASSAVADNARDQVTVTRYDWQGRAVWEKDAEGNVSTRTFDAADNLLTTRYRLDGGAGEWAWVVSTASYDKAGRQVSSITRRELWNGAVSLNQQVTDSSESVAYNAFGEIVAKGHTDADRPLAFTYDRAGQLIADNTTGQTRNYGYDLAGRQVKEWHTAYLGGGSASVTATTRMVVDRLGRTVQAILPSNSANASATLTVNQSYDRWGNVLSVTDARGYVTQYQYNQFSQVVKEVQPTVLVVAANGTESQASPTLTYGYDALGRQVRSVDANGKATTYTYDAGGQQTKVTGAAGSLTTTAYDALGQARYAQNAIGHVTWQDYNRRGQGVAHGDYLPATSGSTRVSAQLEGYVLNANGDRVRVTDALGGVSRYQYDSRGLLLTSRTASGQVTDYGYDLDGHKVRETNALSDASLLDKLQPSIAYQGALVLSQVVAAGRAWSSVLPADAFSTSGNAPFTLSVVIQEAPAGSYTYTASSAFTFNAATRTLSGTPVAGKSYRVLVTGTNTLTGEQASVPLTLQVVSASVYDASYGQNPQVLRGIPDVTVAKGTAFQMPLPANTFSEPQGQAMTYSLWVYENQKVWVEDDDPPLLNQVAGGTGASAEALSAVEPELGDASAPQVAGWLPTEAMPMVRAGGHWEYITDWYALSDSTLAGKLSINATSGQVSGTLATAGAYYLMVVARDPSGNTGSAEFTLTAKGAAPARVTRTDDEGETLYLDEQTWDYDAFGRLVDHNDLSGADYDYAFDSASGQQASQKSDWTTETVSTPIDDYYGSDFWTGYGGKPTGLAAPTYQSTTVSNTRELLYYANGQLREIRETTSAGVKYTRYAYDAAGNRTLEETNTLNGSGVWVKLRTTIEYDALNRIVRVTQTDVAANKGLLDLYYAYDAAGNRRRVLAKGGYGTNQGGTQSLQAGGPDEALARLSDGSWALAGEAASGDEAAARAGVGLAGSWSGGGDNVQALLPIDDPNDPGGWGGGGGGGPGGGNISDSMVNANGYLEYWYAYDAENRVQVVNGKLSGGQILTANNGISYSLSYDAGGRAISRTFYENGVLKQEVTGYDQRDQRQTVAVNGTLTESFSYDEAGRLLKQRTYDGAGLKHLDAFGYDADGRLNRQASYGRTAAGGLDYAEAEGLKQLSTVYYLGFDKAGRSLGYTYQKVANETGVDASNSPVGFRHAYTYQYEAREGYLEKKVLGTSSNSNFKASQTTSTYDMWGRRVAVTESTPGTSVQTTTRAFAYDMEGGILQKSATGAVTTRYAYVGGRNVATGDSGGKLDVVGQLTGYESGELGSSQVTVQGGDTLRTLAQRAYGNGNLWYVIADANGLDGSTPLVQGMSLKVPQVKVTSNDAGTFKPYNPEEIIGNTAPGLPYIAPPPKSGCGTLGKIIMIVVAIVVTIYTAGALTSAVLAANGAAVAGGASVMSVGATALAGGSIAVAGGTASLTALGGMVIGAAAGAAGAAASLAVGSAMGVASFSWRGVAAGAVTGALTGGLAARFGTIGAAANEGHWGKVAALSVANAGANAAGQVVGGGGFSWRGVAANAVSSFVSAGISKGLSKLPDNPFLGNGKIGDDFINNAVGGVVSLHTRRAFGFDDPVNYGNIAVDAFGNALGSAAVRGIQTAQQRHTYEKLLPKAREALQNVHDAKDIRGVLRASLGADIPDVVIDEMASLLEAGKLPEPKYVASDTLGSAPAGHKDGTIYVSRQILNARASGFDGFGMTDTGLLTALTEEYGHYLDYLARNTYSDIGGDSDLDEGALFAAGMLNLNDSTKTVSKDFVISGERYSLSSDIEKMRFVGTAVFTDMRVAQDMKSADGMEYFDAMGHYYTVGIQAIQAGYGAQRAGRIAFFAQMPDMVAAIDATAAFKRWMGRPHLIDPEAASFAERQMQADSDGREWQALLRVQRDNHSLLPAGTDRAREMRATENLILEGLRTNDDMLAGFAIHKFGDMYAHNGYVPPFGHGADAFNIGLIWDRGGLPNAGHQTDWFSLHGQRNMAYAQRLGELFAMGLSDGSRSPGTRQVASMVNIAKTYMDGVNDHEAFETAYSKEAMKSFGPNSRFFMTGSVIPEPDSARESIATSLARIPANFRQMYFGTANTTSAANQVSATLAKYYQRLSYYRTH